MAVLSMTALTATLTCDVVQLATVLPAKLRGGIDAIRVLDKTPRSMFRDHDAIGYIAMGLACLLAAPALEKMGFEGWVRRSLLLGLPWALTAPLFMLMLALLLGRRSVIATQ